MKGKHFWQLMAAAWMLVSTGDALYAQRGGFSPDAVLDRFDQNGNGVLEPHEIEESPLRFMAERMGLDTSRGITRDELSEAMDNARRAFEERGGFDRRRFDDGPSDDSRGRDDDRGGFRSRDDDTERSSYRDSWRDRGTRGRDREPETRSGTAKLEPPRRVTMDLPPAYAEGDRDHDGQIGLYEWTAWKSRGALGEFLGLDRDGDGFLTPRELARAESAEPVDVATLYEVGPRVVPSAAPPTEHGPESSTPPQAASAEKLDVKAVIAAADSGQVKQAERLFSVLDRNRDGTISEDEWAISRKLKPRFEQAGVNLADPMPSDLFVSYYVRIVAADDSI